MKVVLYTNYKDLIIVITLSVGNVDSKEFLKNGVKVILKNIIIFAQMKNKDTFIIVRATSELKDRLLKEARKRGLTLSRIVVEKLNAAVKLSS